MKVSREKKGFQPITIVLETEEEARYMYLALGDLSRPETKSSMALICDTGCAMYSNYSSAYYEREEDYS